MRAVRRQGPMKRKVQLAEVRNSLHTLRMVEVVVSVAEVESVELAALAEHPMVVLAVAVQQMLA